MSMVSSEGNWVGKKTTKRIGGMSDALSLASDLGFSVHSQEESQNESTTACEGDDLIKVLRELTTVQRKIADLQVELQGRKEDKNVAHLTHVGEMEKKIETLGRITTILKDFIQNKDRIIARLQQPYSLDCIPVEAEYQKQFSDLLMIAASDYGALTASVADLQWSQNFKEPPSVWGEMLRPIPVALASCTRTFEAMSAMRESFATLQKLRVGETTRNPPSLRTNNNDSDCVTPPPWKSESSFDNLSQGMEEQFILRVPPSEAERIERLLSENASTSEDKSLDLSFSGVQDENGEDNGRKIIKKSVPALPSKPVVPDTKENAVEPDRSDSDESDDSI